MDASSKQPQLVVPGQRIGSTRDYVAGEGTYALHSHIHASVVGTLCITPSTPNISTTTTTTTMKNQHHSAAILSVKALKRANPIPEIGDTILGKVTKITSTQAHVFILLINDEPCVSSTTSSDGSGGGTGEDGGVIRGIIRKQDIHAIGVVPSSTAAATATANTTPNHGHVAVDDPTSIRHCFRPGDVVRAQILSLGDARSYYLTTAKTELGVVLAKSESAADGTVLVPVSWNQMQCPKTGQREFRKVAKPDQNQHQQRNHKMLTSNKYSSVF